MCVHMDCVSAFFVCPNDLNTGKAEVKEMKPILHGLLHERTLFVPLNPVLADP